MAALGLSDREALPRPTFPFSIPAEEGPAAIKLSAHGELSGAAGHSVPQASFLRRGCPWEIKHVQSRPPILLNSLGKENVGVP